ncbi:MAG: hypothetical protein QHH10_00180 [Peptococcaceae bacterium]|jgi:hypothetical protein|nr:hypothetical protein [Peptococcaceae bacterium]MDH7523721.1 hypothetical protein [Peptococcaceae bacterium]
MRVIRLPGWMLPALTGLVIGLTVSFFNHLILLQGVKKAECLSPEQGKNAIMLRYGLRYILNFATLFLVHKDTAMLVAAAFGLTASKNALFFKNLLNKKERKG